MAYQINYLSENQKMESGTCIRRVILTTAFLMCFVWLVSVFWPDGKELLKQLLIPGNPASAMKAAEVFAAELGSGYSLVDAARNFCETFGEHG